MQLWLFLFNAFQAASQVSTALVSHFAREMDTSVVWTAHDFRLSMIAISIMLPYAAFRARTATGTVQKSPCAADLSLDPTNSKCVSSQMSRFFFSLSLSLTDNSLSDQERQSQWLGKNPIDLIDLRFQQISGGVLTLDATLHYVALRCMWFFTCFREVQRLGAFCWRLSSTGATRGSPRGRETSRHRDIETSNSEETGMKRIEKRGWKKRGCGRWRDKENGRIWKIWKGMEKNV